MTARRQTSMNALRRDVRDAAVPIRTEAEASNNTSKRIGVGIAITVASAAIIAIGAKLLGLGRP